MQRVSLRCANARFFKAASALALQAALGVVLASGPALAEPPVGPPETGLWYDDSGKGAVLIEVCDGNKLCGRIAWLKAPLNAAGEPLTDKNNPKEERRTRPICGLQILGAVRPVEEGGYDGGWVYDPKVGKSYDVAVNLLSPEKLQVTGYLGVKFLGKKLLWTRAESDLPNCAETVTPTGGAGPAAAPANAKTTEKAAPGTKPAKAAKAAAGETLPWSDPDKSKPATKPAASKPSAKPENN